MIKGSVHLKAVCVSRYFVLLLSMDFLSDFEMMLQRKKSMSGKRRRNRDGGTFISDADDVVSAMIVKMNEAAEVRWLTSSFIFLPLSWSDGFFFFLKLNPCLNYT